MKKNLIPTSLLAALLLHGALPQAAHAASGTWNVDTNGLWSLNTNWLNSIIADGSGSTANFTNDITADRTVSLDSARTLTNLVFSDSATATLGSWILDNNGNAANTLTGLGNITVNALGTGKSATISAVIAGSTPITKLGTGTLVLSGANTFNKTDSSNASFAWRLSAGTVVIASDSAFGVTTGTGVTATTLVNLNAVTVQASGSARIVANPTWLSQSSTVSGDQSITFSGTFSGRGGNNTLTNNITSPATLSLTNNVYTSFALGLAQTVTFGGTGNTLISGAIANNTGGAVVNGSIIKSGTGKLTLSGANTYTGTTAVSAGTLLVNSPGSLHASSAVSVANAAILGGSGTINGTVTVSAGGTILLGASSATLTLANSTAPTYNFSGSNYSKLKILASASTLDKVSASATTGNSVANVDLIVDTTGLTGNVSSTTIYSAGGAISGTFRSVSVIGDTSYTAALDYSTSGQIKLALIGSGGGPPTITTSGTLSALSTSYGTASSTTSFTLSGDNMTAGITVTPPAGFEVSKTVGGASGYAGSGTAITVGAAGTISPTTVYVRLAATATVGSSPYSGNITCVSSGATSQNVATVSSTVAPVDLTITANNQSKNFGATQATQVTGSTEFTSSGLKNGETVGTVTLNYSSGALSAGDLPGSTSTITPSAATGGTFNSSNYNIVYNTGTLTVLTAPTITLGGTLGAVDTTYGTASDTPTSFTVSASDLVPDSGNLTVTPPAGYEVSSGASYSTSLSVPYTGGTLSSATVSVRLAATTAVNGEAGYTGNITVAGGGASSQTIATASSTVAPADLIITAYDQTKAYGETQTTPVTGSNEFTPEGLMNNDEIDTVTLTYGTGALDATDAVGTTSTITPSAAAGTLDADNYNISYVPGTLSVIKATPTATLAVNNSPVTYNGSAHAATVDITDSSVTGTLQNIQIGGAADQTNAGTYAVTADFVPNDTTNYDTLTGVSAGNFVIAKADATVVVAPYTVTYDGTPKTATVTSITGVNGETDATVGTVTLNTTHTNAGIYASDSWTFTGTANYNDIDSSISSIAVANGSFETTGSAVGGPWFTFGSPWSITNSPSNYQVINAVTGGAFSSTVAGGGTYIGLVNNDDCPITAPLTQNLGVNVTAGDTLTVTFQRGNPLISPGGAGVAYFDVAGTKYTMPFNTSGMTAGTWQLTTMTQTITNSGNLTLGFYGTTGNGVNVWVDLVSNVSRTSANVQTLLTNTINKATPTATLAVNNSPVTFNGTGQAATVGVTTSSVLGSAQNILTGGAATQTAAGTYAVTANFVPTDSTNYNTLTALSAGNFTINSANYTLTYTAGANGSISGDTPQTVAGGENGTAVTAVADTGYSFVEWDDGSTTNPRTDSNVTGNVSVSATFAINSYTLTYTAGENGSITGETPQTVDYNDSGLEVTAVPATGYRFVDWSDGSTANPRTDSNVAADASVTANFAIDDFTLTYTAGANGSITGDTPQTVAGGESGTAVTAVAATGYSFVDWSDGSTTNPRTDSSVTANVSVTANFAINTYTLTYTAGANGSITGTTSQTVDYNTSGTAVTAVPATGYSFVSWSDSSTTNPRTDSSVTANVSVTANFAINTFTLAYTAGANGSITGTTSQTVDYNTSGTAVTAVPATGYSFVDWSDGSTTNPRTDSSVTANVSVTANFAIDAITYADWATANGVTGGVNGDSNNDGVSNGVAYFMGENGQATNPGLNPSNEVTWSVNQDYQGTFKVQTSSDLSTWTDADPQPTPSGGNLTYTLTGSGKQFVRLSVTPE